MTKICTKCFCEKSLAQFAVDLRRNKSTARCYACERLRCVVRVREDPERYRGIRRRWELKNRYKKSAQVSAWRQRRKEHIRQHQRNRIKNDPNFRIARNLRNRLWNAVAKEYKNQRTLALLGCGLEDLKQHLEKQFRPGMAWANYGEWHIDHIRPCASFDLTKPEQQKQCFHWSNLQPLWAEDNLRKRAKFDDISR